MRMLMPIATVTLALAYIVAAMIRAYVGWVVEWVRRPYWVSVPACLGLSANQWWLLARGQPVIDSRIMFGQTMAMYFVASVAIHSAIVALRDHDAGSGR